MWLQAPANDYRSLNPDPDRPPTLRVAVCIPVYNRVELLARTVAGLAAQTYPSHLMQVVIGDDGSEEDVDAALAPLRDRIEISVHRRQRDGYGAGQARNLAAARAAVDVLVFVDADCLPDRDLVRRHAAWHEEAENLVVIGSRHGLDSTAFSLADLADGHAKLRDAVFGSETLEPEQVHQTDHRRSLHRRTSNQRFGDEAFRSLVSSNFSIRRDRFLDVGGFDESFHRWGGEDVELGWRCYTAGYFIVIEDAAIVYHQLQEDAWEAQGREQSKARNAGVIQNKIPHSFYRKHQPGHLWEVPKVSVVTIPTVPARLGELIEQTRRQSYTDWELIAAGGSEQAQLEAEANAFDPRIRIVAAEDDRSLLLSARGEYVALVHGDVALEPRLLSNVVRRLETDRRAAIAICGYLVGADVYRHRDDLATIDRAWDLGNRGIPLFSLVRKREWSKALHGGLSLGEAFGLIGQWSRVASVHEPMIGVRSEAPGPGQGESNPSFDSPTTRLRRELSEVGLRPAAVKAVARYAVARRQRHSSIRPAPPKSTDLAKKPVVRYVGWTGRDNMGDEALLRAITDALPWAEVRTAKRGDLLLLGGGTLINRGSYISWLEEQDSPRIERAVFGTGVANPAFWGESRDVERWRDWIETCAYVGVRGPLSQEILDGWGIKAEIEIVGDPALLLERSAETAPGRVVIAPCRTRGELWGGDDEKVFRALADLVGDLTKRGHDLHMLASHPDDDGPIIRIMRMAGRTDLPYLAGYQDLDETMALLASAEVVVAERLHAAVLAAACGTPFVAIEYRPKLRDFARSVGFEPQTLRSDDLGGLIEMTQAVLSQTSQLRAQLRPQVDQYRRRLQRASQRLAEIMGV